MSAQIDLLRQFTSKLGRVFEPGNFYKPGEFEDDVLATLISCNYALKLERGQVLEIPEVKEEPKKRKAGRPRKYETREMVSK